MLGMNPFQDGKKSQVLQHSNHGVHFLPRSRWQEKWRSKFARMDFNFKGQSTVTVKQNEWQISSRAKLMSEERFAAAVKCLVDTTWHNNCWSVSCHDFLYCIWSRFNPLTWFRLYPARSETRINPCGLTRQSHQNFLFWQSESRIFLELLSLLEVVFLGQSGTGKTSLIRQFVYRTVITVVRWNEWNEHKLRWPSMT
jgi:hypothetical protein